MIQQIKFDNYIEFADNEGELYGPFETETEIDNFIKASEKFRGHAVEWWPKFRKAEA